MPLFWRRCVNYWEDRILSWRWLSYFGYTKVFSCFVLRSIFLISGDVGFTRLICGLVELFGGFYWYWVATTRVFLFWVLVTTMDTTACKLVDPTLLSWWPFDGKALRLGQLSRDSKMCYCCCRFCCGAPTTDERIHAPVLHDASQIDYCRYWGRASLPPIKLVIYAPP